MILDSLTVPVDEFAARTGWTIKPQGACKGDRCIPLGGAGADGTFDVRLLADKLGMPIVEGGGLYAIGPESGARAITDVEAPNLTLPDVHGDAFELRSLRGQKVLLLAWASW